MDELASVPPRTPPSIQVGKFTGLHSFFDLVAAVFNAGIQSFSPPRRPVQDGEVVVGTLSENGQLFFQIKRCISFELAQRYGILQKEPIRRTDLSFLAELFMLRLWSYTANNMLTLEKLAFQTPEEIITYQNFEIRADYAVVRTTYQKS